MRTAVAPEWLAVASKPTTQLRTHQIKAIPQGHRSPKPQHPLAGCALGLLAHGDF